MMSLKATVLFDRPQREIASTMRSQMQGASEIRLVSGFMTVEGIKVLVPTLRANVAALQSVVVGAGTYRAFRALDELLAAGLQTNRVFVHLGHTALTQSAKAKFPFMRYHPMLHSKVIYIEKPDGTATAFVGSHNLTGFALMGRNGEAGVMLEGPRSDPQFDAVREHLRIAESQAVTYRPDMKEAYAWWNTQFLDGLRTKANDIPKDGESKKTVIVLAEAPAGESPMKGENLYFELPRALDSIITSLKTEVHVYLFSTLPATPWQALAMKHTAAQTCWCKTVGIEKQQGGVELLADWEISNVGRPRIRPTPTQFRPTPAPGMQQVRVEVNGTVFEDFEYLFEGSATKWLPVLGDEALEESSKEYEALLRELELDNFEDRKWQLVRGLTSDENREKSALEQTLQEMSPDKGAFILVSSRRRSLGKKAGG